MSRHLQSSRFSVAIIGGGFTGGILAAQLLANSGSEISVVLIERGFRVGQGLAYSTHEPGHLLNVPAANMSAFAADPDSFLRWARQNFDSGVQPGDFLPRHLYGQYVESLVKEAGVRNSQRFLCERDEAIGMSKAGNVARIHLRSGKSVSAQKVVLALGNLRPRDIPLPGKPEHTRIADPWAADALEAISADDGILLVGSGLTSVDMVLALRTRGFRGTVHILSRHGLLPQKHRACAPSHAFWNKTSPRTARGLLRLVREQVNAIEASGGDWRSVIDSLRPFTQAI